MRKDFLFFLLAGSVTIIATGLLLNVAHSGKLGSVSKSIADNATLGYGI